MRRPIGPRNNTKLRNDIVKNRKLLLLRNIIDKLAAKDFAVYINEKVPPNDGGIALGQAVIASFLAS